MIDKDLLAILACPQSHQALTVLSAAGLQALNERIAAGGVKTAGGTSLSEALEAGLLRQDQTVVYPIRDAIPVLLVDEGILIGDLGLEL